MLSLLSIEQGVIWDNSLRFHTEHLCITHAEWAE